MKKFAALSLASLALVLTGCGGNATAEPSQSPQPTVTVTATPSPSPTATHRQQLSDSQFADLVRESYPNSTSSDKQIVDLAKAACNAFERGATKQKVIEVIVGTASTTAEVEEFGFIIGAGEVVYCPNHG